MAFICELCTKSLHIGQFRSGLIHWCRLPEAGGGGDAAYERGGDARRKFGINPLKETDLGVAQAFFDP